MPGVLLLDSPPWAHHLRVEFREHDARGSHPQRAQQLIDHPVDVVQRQHVQDHILLLPLPLLNQPRGLRGENKQCGLRAGGKIPLKYSRIPEVFLWYSQSIQAPNSLAGMPSLPEYKIFPLGSAGEKKFPPKQQQQHTKGTSSPSHQDVPVNQQSPFLVTEKYQQ